MPSSPVALNGGKFNVHEEHLQFVRYAQSTDNNTARACVGCNRVYISLKIDKFNKFNKSFELFVLFYSQTKTKSEHTSTKRRALLRLLLDE